MNDLSEEEMKTLLAAMDTRMLVLEETAKAVSCDETKQALAKKQEMTQALYNKLARKFLAR